VRKTDVALALLALTSALSCSSSSKPDAATLAPATHSGPIAISPDGSRLYVVHPDADLVAVVDTTSANVVFTIALTAASPSRDPEGNYFPAAEPRALALDPSGTTLYVTGERSGHVYAFDASSGAKVADAAVCAEPIGVLVDGNGANVFVACSADDVVAQLTASSLSLVTKASAPHKPWALAWAADGATLLSTHLLGWGDAAGAHPASSAQSSPGVTAFGTAPLAMKETWDIADEPAGGTQDVPHGLVRGVYDAMIRPGTSELWTVHVLLGTDTPQPDLDFQSTIFPAVTITDGTSGARLARLTVSTSPGDGAAFGDVVSGPRALTFSPDGRFAFVVDNASEDVLIIDATARVEAALVRPLPGHQPDGAVWGNGGRLYVSQRNTTDVAVIDVTLGDAGVTATVESAVIGKLANDPMPGNLRLGQHLFYSANSDEYPLTSNHWLSCSACHLEGRSDAVTWKFAEGPRDTPSNAGGVRQTGFLFRTADRNSVTDYWKTIDVEQGGDFATDEPTQVPLLEALANFVNYAIPLPTPPTVTDASLVSRGQQVFVASHCDSCHSGSWLTDSGQGNASLDLAGPVVSQAVPGGVLLHDVGTCVTAPYADVAHDTILGEPRAACAFDTPTLRGIADSAPYLHDGSALTLEDAVLAMLAGAQNDPMGREVPKQLSPGDMQALVAYLRSL
jgi:DNA-binding beta-propeller fold protein YncE